MPAPHCETASAKSFLAFFHGVRICHTSVDHTRLYRPASRRRNGARMEATVFNHALPLARASITFSVAPVCGRCVRDQYLWQKIPPPKTFRAQALMQRIPPATSRRHRRQIRTVSPPCGGHGAPPSLHKKLLYSIILYHGIFLQECLPPEHCQAGTSKQNCESAYGAMLKSMISLVQRRRLADPGSGSEGA